MNGIQTKTNVSILGKQINPPGHIRRKNIMQEDLPTLESKMHNDSVNKFLNHVANTPDKKSHIHLEHQGGKQWPMTSKHRANKTQSNNMTLSFDFH